MNIIISVEVELQSCDDKAIGVVQEGSEGVRDRRSAAAGGSAGLHYRRSAARNYKAAQLQRGADERHRAAAAGIWLHALYARALLTITFTYTFCFYEADVFELTSLLSSRRFSV